MRARVIRKVTVKAFMLSLLAFVGPATASMPVPGTAPRELHELQKRIDEIAGTEQWVKGIGRFRSIVSVLEEETTSKGP